MNKQMAISNIQGVIFDMDGTLIDSELFTEQAVERLLTEEGLPTEGMDYKQFYGITWKNIESILQGLFEALKSKPLAAKLQHYFHSEGIKNPPDAIEGSPCAVQSAGKFMKAAIGTSSNRETLEEVIDQLGVRESLGAAVSAEDYQNSKPAPDCYLLAAKNLNVEPARCLVFEDSIPGIKAARAAGMAVIAITHRCTDENLAKELADMAISNYTELPEDFWQSIKAGS
ncbi:MAG: HAD family phosphatase [Deltaproteobacteria bacterium]|nr:HAD family phosphatase [Deltaproteobacteria bacterium]